MSAETPLEPIDAYGSIRGRVGQQVDAIADSANKVISGVVDSSFGILRSFMPAGGVDPKSPSTGRITPGTPRHGFGLLRRESGFSIASIAASLPITRTRSNTNQGEEFGQQLVTVSRPGSVKSRTSMRSRHSLKIRVGGENIDDEDGSDNDEESETTDDEDGSDSDDGPPAHADKGDEFAFDYDADEVGTSAVGDTRSIRSFESMLSASKDKDKDKSRVSRARKSLSDRLATVSALAAKKVRNLPPKSSIYVYILISEDRTGYIITATRIKTNFPSSAAFKYNGEARLQPFFISSCVSVTSASTNVPAGPTTTCPSQTEVYRMYAG